MLKKIFFLLPLYKLGTQSRASIEFLPLFPFSSSTPSIFQVGLWSPCSLIMHRRPSFKGKKRQASPTPSSSSVEGDSTLDQSRLVKKSRLTSPARVKQAVLAKVANKSKLGSSSKGLAGFAALVNNSNLAAARKETNRGLRSGSSSTQTRGGTSAKSKTGKTVSLRLSVSFTRLITYYCFLY